MSTPNPLIPQGTTPHAGKSHVRIAIFAILAIHLVGLGGLLLFGGCKKTEEPPLETTKDSTLPPLPPLPDPVLTTPTPTQAVLTPIPVPPVVTSTPVVVSVPPVIPRMPEPANTFPPPVSSVSVGGGSEHVVARNDSFYTLGKKYGVSMRAIAEANPGVDSNRLKIGQKLRIPAATGGTTGGANAAAGFDAASDKTYTVKSGDTLGKIAKSHGVTLKALRAANGLRADQIKVGQKLKVPGKADTVTPSAVVPPVPAPEATPTPVFPPPQPSPVPPR